jgi:hypothetical protein
VKALREKERRDETQFTAKIGGKLLVWVPRYFVLGKISFPVKHLMADHAKNWPVLAPLNPVTLPRTLIYIRTTDLMKDFDKILEGQFRIQLF